MHIRIPQPSRKAFAAFILLSAILHLAVCKLPVQSSVIDEGEDSRVLQVSLVSVAAPSISGNEADDSRKQDVKKLPEIESVIGSGTLLEEQRSEEDKARQSLTSNDNGRDPVTVEPVLGENDYVQTVAPEYPQRSIERGQEGTVIVRALITNSGGAQKVHVFNSSGFELLDDSAAKAVSRWKFRSSLAKNAAGLWVQVPVKFVIK